MRYNFQTAGSSSLIDLSESKLEPQLVDDISSRSSLTATDTTQNAAR